MPKINLPENTLEKETYSSLPSLEKGEFTHNFLKEILRLNSTGITISQIEKNTYLSHSIIWHHLEILASKGECLRIERGDVDVYHFNKVIDILKQFDIPDDNSAYHFSYNFDLIENTFGRFIRIQRQRESRSATHTTRSGVIIPYHLVSQIANILIKIKENHLNEDKSTK